MLVISKYGLDVNFNSRVFQRTQRITVDPHSRRCHTFSQAAIISMERAHRIQQNKCFRKQTGAFFLGGGNFETRKYVGKFNLRFNTNVTQTNKIFKNCFHRFSLSSRRRQIIKPWQYSIRPNAFEVTL